MKLVGRGAGLIPLYYDFDGIFVILPIFPFYTTDAD